MSLRSVRLWMLLVANAIIAFLLAVIMEMGRPDRNHPATRLILFFLFFVVENLVGVVLLIRTTRRDARELALRKAETVAVFRQRLRALEASGFEPGSSLADPDGRVPRRPTTGARRWKSVAGGPFSGVIVRVRRVAVSDVHIPGKKDVGTVTRPGLERSPGSPTISPVRWRIG